MESPLIMIGHAAGIGIALYVIMLYGLGQPEGMALARSSLLAALVAAYMIAYGHGLPKALNPDLLG